MPQIFHRSTNTISRVSLVLAVLAVAGFFFFALQAQRSPYFSWSGVAREQPVPFSHKHHVGDEGIDCRYCHTSVEVSSFAGIPPTKTCMNCHSQIWTNAEMLEPVRASFRTGTPLQWQRVNMLPDFVYFNHSIHIAKGVGCATCHGPVDRMPLMLAQHSLEMEWCLDCHRAPEKYLRPKSEVFNMDYAQPSSTKPVSVNGRTFTSQLELGSFLREEYHLRSVYDITSCDTCHR
jgi:Cytochrome c7 and related cytochrome c